MDVRQLKYFVTIVERGSFTKASELLGIAQPSLGFQIRKLEDELNVQLLVRTARGVQLTEPGQLLFERGKEILTQISDLTRSISNISDEPHGVVAFGLTPSLAGRFLLQIIERSRFAFPKISLNVTEEMSHDLVELLDVGKICFALAYNVLPHPVRGMVMDRLADEDIVLLMHPSQAPKSDAPIRFSDLRKYPLILPRRPHRLRDLAEKAAQQCNVELNVIYEMQSLPTILRLVEHGLGATLIAGGNTNLMLLEHRLVTRKIIRPSLRHDVSIIHLETRPLSRAEDCVAAIVRNLVKSEYAANTA